MARLQALAWCLLALAALAAAPAAGTVPGEPQQLLATQLAPPQQQRCADKVPVHWNLTAQEQELLQYICWPPEGVEAGAQAAGAAADAPLRGVLAGVNCTVVQWCDGDTCSDVCQRGSVWVAPWLAHAIRQQTKLVQSLPLCWATILGTHNSAITLADGYGNLDTYFQGFFKYVKWAVKDFSGAPLHTNNQLLSLTDQLNLGVRSLEIDTHWVGGILRIAHCGGLHVPLLNKLVDALNLVARLLHRTIRWDTETMGCVPSLSSIPALEQRLLTDVFQEVKAWLDAPDNAQEFLVLYFDDQLNLETWGVVGHLLEDILSVFPADWIYTTDDKAVFGEGWPSQQQMVLAGKRLLLVSGTDYGEAMQPLVFSRGQTLCGWNEPPLASVDGVPHCQVNDVAAVEPRPLFDGLLTRVIACELQYGPLNCDFVWGGTNAPVFDEATLPPVMGCGLNMPAPDLLTPSRAAAAIWTWAPGHPYEPSYGGSPALAALAQRARGQHAAAVAAPPANCGVLTASDARWRAVPCSLPAMPSACRWANASLGAAGGGWVVDSSLPRGTCPDGAQYDLPRHPRENYLLAAALQAAGHEAAWLPVHGPDWSTAGWPAERQQRQRTSARHVLVHAALPAAGSVAGLAALVAGAVVGRRWLLRRRAPDGLYQALALEASA